MRIALIYFTAGWGQAALFRSSSDYLNADVELRVEDRLFPLFLQISTPSRCPICSSVMYRSPGHSICRVLQFMTIA